MFNFRKISAVLTSAVMIGSSIGIAAAANYPSPFVVGGTADVAIVYGADSPSWIDLIPSANIQTNLQTYMSTASGGTSGSVSGEATPLFTSSSKIYINDTLNVVKSALTKSEMPIILVDQSFSGNVDATMTQTITLGSNPQVTYAKMPKSSDDPEFGLAISSTVDNVLYNASVTFNKAVNLTHADSEGEDITMFGQTFTIASATDSNDLVLLKEAEKLSLDTETNPSQEVTISGAVYTIELVSCSDTAATIKVTNSAGTSESKEVSEAASKKINGVTIAINTADETNFKLAASIVAGAEKITMTDGSAVTSGEDATTIDGTKVDLIGGTTALTKLVVQVAAKNSDNDAIKPGTEFIDPVFGSFKMDFSGLNIPEDGSAREDIIIAPSGEDKMELTFTDHSGYTKTFQWAINFTSTTGAGLLELQHDSDGRNISVMEGEKVYKEEYVVLGNQDNGHLLKVSAITNQTTGYNNDKVKFTDVFSSTIYEATLSAEGTGTVTIGGQVYNLNYYGASTDTDDAKYVILKYADKPGDTTAILYPSIETSKGAKIMLYEPKVINVTNFCNDLNQQLTDLYIPDGDGYRDSIAWTDNITQITIGGTAINASQDATGDPVAVNITAGELVYEFVITDTTAPINASVTVYLVDPTTGAIIKTPALVILEEKSDNTRYQGMVVTIEDGASGDDGIGVNDVIRTWQDDGTWDSISLYSDSKVSKEADLWGTIVTVDSSDSDQKTATISYPDEQLYAQIYAAEIGASIIAGTVGTGTITQIGEVIYKDTEVSSVGSKNLIVVGGSCINTVAANLLGGAHCTSAFTESTGVGTGQYLIQSFDSPYAEGSQIALVVAGYEAADTVNAQKALTTQTIDTTIGKKYKGTSSTDATEVTA